MDRSTPTPSPSPPPPNIQMRITLGTMLDAKDPKIVEHAKKVIKEWDGYYPAHVTKGIFVNVSVDPLESTQTFYTQDITNEFHRIGSTKLKAIFPKKKKKTRDLYITVLFAILHLCVCVFYLYSDQSITKFKQNWWEVDSVLFTSLVGAFLTVLLTHKLDD